MSRGCTLASGFKFAESVQLGPSTTLGASALGGKSVITVTIGLRPGTWSKVIRPAPASAANARRLADRSTPNPSNCTVVNGNTVQLHLAKI
jgi:hypothetical protein